MNFFAITPTFPKQAQAKKVICQLCVVVLTLAAFVAQGQSQLVYEFHQEGTGDIYATLEFSELPVFDISVISELEILDPADPSFSAVIELEETDLFALIFADDSNGLGEGALIARPEAPLIASDAWVFNGATQFIIEFKPDPLTDETAAWIPGVDGGPIIRGDWLLAVPEPAARTIIPMVILVCSAFGRRRRDREHG